VRFRRIDLCALVADRFGIRLAERTMGSLLGKPGLRRLSVRPQHPKSDPEAQELYKNFADLVRRALPVESADSCRIQETRRGGVRIVSINSDGKEVIQQDPIRTPSVSLCQPRAAGGLPPGAGLKATGLSDPLKPVDAATLQVALV
jgi:hypothetical protein